MVWKHIWKCVNLKQLRFVFSSLMYVVCCSASTAAHASNSYSIVFYQIKMYSPEMYIYIVFNTTCGNNLINCLHTYLHMHILNSKHSIREEWTIQEARKYADSWASDLIPHTYIYVKNQFWKGKLYLLVLFCLFFF